MLERCMDGVLLLESESALCHQCSKYRAKLLCISMVFLEVGLIVFVLFKESASSFHFELMCVFMRAVEYKLFEITWSTAGICV